MPKFSKYDNANTWNPWPTLEVSSSSVPLVLISHLCLNQDNIPPKWCKLQVNWLTAHPLTLWLNLAWAIQEHITGCIQTIVQKNMEHIPSFKQATTFQWLIRSVILISIHEGGTTNNYHADGKKIRALRKMLIIGKSFLGMLIKQTWILGLR